MASGFFPQLPVASDNFFIEEFLNLPNDDAVISDASFESVDVSSCNSSSSSSSVSVSTSASITMSDPSIVDHVDGISPAKSISSVTSSTNFTGDLCVSCDDFPEEEWLSNIGEESLSSEDLQKMELISGMRARSDNSSEVVWERELITDVNGQNGDTLVTYQEMELVSDVKERNDDVSKNMWEMELISGVREQNDDALVSFQEMELISDVKTRNDDALETMHNIDVKTRNENALETVQNLGVEAQIQYASETVQKLEMISCVKGPNNDILETAKKIEMISQIKGQNNEVSQEACQFHIVPNQNGLIFDTEVFVPAKSRSKRACGPPSNWTSRLLLLSPTRMPAELELVPELEPKLKLELELEPKQRNEFVIPTLNQFVTGVSSKKPTKSTCRRKENNDGGSGGDGRRCLHCATDKTPQWRTGPMGPKTLCNACGVRYKSGRLVPEYRPAASPTFVMAKHSNSHRKVMELRRQKEVQHQQHHQQQPFFQHHHHHHHRPDVMFDTNISNRDGILIYDPNFRQMI